MIKEKRIWTYLAEIETSISVGYFWQDFDCIFESNCRSYLPILKRVLKLLYVEREGLDLMFVCCLYHRESNNGKK